MSENSHADLSVGAFFQMRSDNLYNIIEKNISKIEQEMNENSKSISSTAVDMISDVKKKSFKNLNENNENATIENETVSKSTMKNTNNVDDNLRKYNKTS